MREILVLFMASLSDCQFRTKSPLAFWSAGGRQERHWRIREKLHFLIGCPVTACIVLPQKSCGNKLKFQFSRVSQADHPLTKKPEVSVFSQHHRKTNANDTLKYMKPVLSLGFVCILVPRAAFLLASATEQRLWP